MSYRVRLIPAVVMLVLLTAASAYAKGLHSNLGTNYHGDIEDMQLFAPAEVRPYGNGPQPKEGFFFVFDGLSWSISTPEVTTVGFQGLTRNVYYGPTDADMIVQENTLDTGLLRADFTEGNRIEFGRVVDGRGWFLSVYQLKSQTQNFSISDVDMVFVDDAFGPSGTKLLEGYVPVTMGYGTSPGPPSYKTVGTGMVYDYDYPEIIRDLPVTFDEVSIRNRVETWSVEWMYLHRLRQNRHGGIFELFFGVRYMAFDDEFDVHATGESRFIVDDQGSPTGPGSVLANSWWNTKAENHIVGPQIGARWFRKSGRWMLSTEGRFFAGFNSQNIRQHGVFGTQLNDSWPDEFEYPGPPGNPYVPHTMSTTSFEDSEHISEWSPVAELRAEARFQITRAVSLRAGWTGIWMDGIARASNMINYEVAAMGIADQFNRQEVFMHGLTFGIDVNR